MVVERELIYESVSTFGAEAPIDSFWLPAGIFFS